MRMFTLLLLLPILLAQQTTVNVETEATTTVSTSTEKSTTTPSEITTTSAPRPAIPNYVVKNGTIICLMVEMNVKFAINYFNKKGEKLSRNFYLNSTSDFAVKTGGECGLETERLELEWWPEKSKPSWDLDLVFTKRETGHFSLDVIAFNYTITDVLFPDTNDTTTHFVSKNSSQFSCPLGSYFQCMTKQTFKLDKTAPQADEVVQPDVFVTISSLKAEAFRASDSPIFVGTMSECSADYVPNKVVPIVVGVALASMIIIALITFIIGSRRRQAGYQEI